MFPARSVKHLGTDLNESKMVMFDGHVVDFHQDNFDLSTFSYLLSNIGADHMTE